MKSRILCFALLLVSGSLTTSSGAHAQAVGEAEGSSSAKTRFLVPGSVSVELFLGNTFREEGELDYDTATFGLRAGYSFSRLRLTGSVARYSKSLANGRYTQPGPGQGPLTPVKREAYVFDFSAEFPLTGGPSFELLAHAGAGFAMARATDAEESDIISRSSSTPISFSVGVGARIGLGRGLYTRPDVRARWQDDSQSDIETTLAVGWTFGR